LLFIGVVCPISFGQVLLDRVTRTAPKSLVCICIFLPYILYRKTNY